MPDNDQQYFIDRELWDWLTNKCYPTIIICVFMWFLVQVYDIYKEDARLKLEHLKVECSKINNQKVP